MLSCRSNMLRKCALQKIQQNRTAAGGLRTNTNTNSNKLVQSVCTLNHCYSRRTSKNNGYQFEVLRRSSRSLSGLILPPGREEDKDDYDELSIPSTILPGNRRSLDPSQRRKKDEEPFLFPNTKSTPEKESGPKRRRPSRSRRNRRKKKSLDEGATGVVGAGTQSSTTTKPRKKGLPRGAEARIKKTSETESKPKKNPSASIEQELQQWYDDNHGVEFRNKCITLKKVSQPGPKGNFTLWTAQFKCPIRGEVFDCGTLRGESDEIFESIDGQICYHKMAYARAAALARALDYKRYRDDKTSSTNNRLCLEEPSSSSSTLERSPVGEVGEKQTATAVAPESVQDDAPESDKIEMNSPVKENASVLFSEVDDDGDDDDDDDEEYTIQYLPGSAPNDLSSQENVNPMARVIGTWSETPIPLRQKIDSSASILTFNPELELQKLLRNAQDWIQQEQPEEEKSDSEHRVMLHGMDSPRTLEIGRSILYGLSKANRRVLFQDKPRGVEETATKVLNFLWSTSSAQPDADVYAAYIGCLEGPDLSTVAERAKLILDDMENERTVAIANGRKLPKPNINVVNAVIQTCAQVGGESGRYDLDRIENPNRETFLSVLSSMCYPAAVERETSGFDPIFAQQCIDQMYKLSNENPADASLKPDTQVYNAGLRWSGGSQSTISRPYMRRLPWDSHANIFQNGFRPFDEDSEHVQDAYRMHAWLEEMGSSPDTANSLGDTAPPDIETYESIIQAYVRTGTLEGVKQAEDLLDSLMDSPSYRQTLRMQTFHPVIAAWAYSGHKMGPEKVSKWVGRLEDMVEDGVDLNLDCRVREALLLANSSRLLHALRGVVDATVTEQLLDTAYGCSAHLQDLCAKLKGNTEGIKQSTTMLDANLFVLVIHMWGKLGLHLLTTAGDSAEARKALQKMKEAIEEFEDLVVALDRRGPSDTTGDLQLHHLADNAHKLYSVFLDSLQQIDQVKESLDLPELSDGDLDMQIHNIEQWVRRINEFGRIDRSGHDDKDGDVDDKHIPSEILYDDMYSYTSTGSAEIASSDSDTDFLIRVLKSLKDNFQNTSQRRGDLLRICFLTLDLLPTNRDQEALTDAYKHAVEAICHLSTGPDEQGALLMRVLERVEWLRDEKASFLVDHDGIIKEIRKHSMLPKSSTGRPSARQRRRGSTMRSGRASPQGADLVATADIQTLLENET